MRVKSVIIKNKQTGKKVKISSRPRMKINGRSKIA